MLLKSSPVDLQRTFKKSEESLTSMEFGTLVVKGSKKRTNNKVLNFIWFI